MNNQFDKSIIASYVYRTLRTKDLELAEELIGTHGKLHDYYSAKVEERDFLLQLVPDKQISVGTLRALKNEISETMDEIYPKEKKSLTKSVAEILDKPIFTIKI